VRLLADALQLADPVKAAFEAAGRGHRPGAEAAANEVGGAAVATRTLPRDIASFTGRQAELDRLVEAAAGTGGVVGIQAIGGMAGVGKTAFAVYAAHRLADRFPDGQVFLPLHGHTRGYSPVNPADALASLLHTAGIGPAHIPPDLEGRARMWRDHLAGKRMLLVLDDAIGSEQVQPLLPGAGESLVLVTSRRHLTALEDAHVISLDVLAPGEAAALLVRLTARPGLAPDDPAVATICRLCGYLPLAIGMLARQLHHHPAWTPDGLAADLAAARNRLELMSTENVSVAAAFDLSYADLDDDHRRMFRRLGLHPGSDFDAYAAAALDGCALTPARRRLATLYEHYLLTEPMAARYRLHDLLREHAHALALREDTARDRDQALDRLLDYYAHAADQAGSHLARHTRSPADRGRVTPPAEAPDLTDEDTALAWARAERTNLLACLNLAGHRRDHGRVVALTAAEATLLAHGLGPWAEAVTRHAAAVRAAQQSGDRPGQANALYNLGVMRQRVVDYPGAAQALEEALDIYREQGNRLGEANVLSELGSVRRRVGDYPAAAGALEAALSIYRDLGDRLGQANSLLYLGTVRRLPGDYQGAAGALEAALGLYRELGNQLGQAHALSELGAVRRHTGDYRGAAEAQETALATSRAAGDRNAQASALNNLGIARLGIGDYPAATAALEAALSICRDLGNEHGQANALKNLGVVRARTGDYPGAASAFGAALSIYRGIGDPGGEVEALNGTGVLHLTTGDLGQAEEYHRQALELAGEIDSAWDEAHARAGLGRCALAAGRRADGIAGLRAAEEIFRRLGAGEAAEVADELSALGDGSPAGE